MRHAYLFLSAMLLSGMGFAQLPYSELDSDYQQIDPANHFEQSSNENAARGTTSCQDTTLWALYRSVNGGNFSFFTLFMENDTNGFIGGWSTFFDVPSGATATISGFEFYARSLRADSADVTITCQIYNAAPSDSTPMGSPLASVNVDVSPYQGGFVSGFLQSAEFSSAVSVSGDFCIVMDVQGAVGDSIEILRGFTGSGAPDYPTSFRVPALSPTMWFPASLFGAAGARIAHVYPYVTFDASNSITFSEDTLCEVDQMVNVGGMAPSWLTSEYWTIEGYTGSESSFWSVSGGAFSTSPTADTMITFADPTVDVLVGRNDSLTMWNFSSCVVTETAELIGGASETDVAVENIATGANSDSACANGPGTSTIHTLDGTGVFYNVSVIECDPDYVSAGFYSNGSLWWEFDNNGMLIDSGTCEPEGINSLSKGGYNVFMQHGTIVINRDEVAQIATSAQVFDLSGRIIAEQIINAGNVGRVASFDLTEQPSGMYLVKVGEDVTRVVR